MSIPTFNAYLHALLNPQAAGYLPPLTIPSNLSGQASGSSGLRIANPAAPSESGVGEGVGDVEQTGILGLDLRGVETEIPSKSTTFLYTCVYSLLQPTSTIQHLLAECPRRGGFTTAVFLYNEKKKKKRASEYGILIFTYPYTKAGDGASNSAT